MRVGLDGSITRLVNSQPLLLTLVGSIGLSMVASWMAFLSLAFQVTLTVDGETAKVWVADNGTVKDVLADREIDLSEHDAVTPDLNTQLTDGDEIEVRFGRPVFLSVDGDETKHWVLATELGAALSEIGLEFPEGSKLSAAPDAEIDRDGINLEVITAKEVRLQVGLRKPVTERMAALNVSDVLDSANVDLGERDIVRPKATELAEDGMTIKVIRVRVAERTLAAERIPFETVRQDDSDLALGEEWVLHEGVPGKRQATYRVWLHNGKLHKRELLSQKVISEPVDQVIRVGTQTGGDTAVWDQLAVCETNGVWTHDTGDGYYGGLRIEMTTWQRYGGRSYPHLVPKADQIAIAIKIRDNEGGYGYWSSCAGQLGLPT